MKLTTLAVIVASVVAFYIGKMSQDKSQIPSPPFPPPNNPELIEQQIKAEEELKKSMTLKSQSDLPQIAQAAVDYALKNGSKNPKIMFSSNDGEYATVNIGEAIGIGGYSLFLVKRENKWIPLIAGQDSPPCSELLPLREKYNLSKEFLKCAEEF